MNHCTSFLPSAGRPPGLRRRTCWIYMQAPGATSCHKGQTLKAFPLKSLGEAEDWKSHWAFTIVLVGD